MESTSSYSTSLTPRQIGLYALKATVSKSRTSGFGGPATPTFQCFFLVHGGGERVAETRAVNRALRKAYGIGICSVEEIGFPSRRNLPESRRDSHHNLPTGTTAVPKYVIAFAS